MEEFKDNGVPGLFNTLAEGDAPEEQWRAIRFPIDIDVSQYEPQKQIKILMRKFLLRYLFEKKNTKIYNFRNIGTRSRSNCKK